MTGRRGKPFNRKRPNEGTQEPPKKKQVQAKSTTSSDEETCTNAPIRQSIQQDKRDLIQSKLHLEMPADFFAIWDFVVSLVNKANPNDALSEAGIQLTGPYDLLAAGKLMEDKPEEFYLTYQRFYYDPPEFQTVVLYGDLKLGQHLGYFRDDPKEMPAFLASNTESKGCTITPMGPNLFSALNTVLNEAICKDISKKSALKSLQTKLADWAKTHGFDLQPKNAEMKVRNSKSLAKTFHGAGMVVPYNKKTQLGYREIPETNANLKKILAKIVESETDDERDSNFDPLQEIITNVQFANDEGDPGMGLELGLDLFCYGGESLHSTLLHLFPVAYDLLNRPLYTRIIKAHLANRRRLASHMPNTRR